MGSINMVLIRICDNTRTGHYTTSACTIKDSDNTILTDQISADILALFGIRVPDDLVCVCCGAYAYHVNVEHIVMFMYRYCLVFYILVGI